jgi:hypothetical protein
MPAILTVKADTSQIKRAFADLGRKAPTAIARALNRTASTVRTQAVRAISKDLNIQQKRVRERLTIDRATRANLTATVEAKAGGSGIAPQKGKAAQLGRIPLMEFQARTLYGGPRYKTRKIGTRATASSAFARTTAGVRYRLPTGKGKIVEAFIATMKSGHTGVFVSLRGQRTRFGKQRILELFGPSVPHVLAQTQILSATKTLAMSDLKKNLAHETDYLLSKQRA